MTLLRHDTYLCPYDALSHVDVVLQSAYNDMRQETNGAEWSDESGDDVDDKQFRVMIKFQSAPPADDDNPHGPMLLSFCF